MAMRDSAGKQRGFTLVELLVVIAVTGILTGIVFVLVSNAMNRASAIREVASGKALIAAYCMYANDHDGSLLPAIDKTAGGKGNPVVFKPENRNITFMEAPHRYPFRLAPYFDYQMEKILLINGLAKKVDKIFGKQGGMRDYGISLCPALGMNHRFCGGYVEPSGNLDYPSQKEAITRMSRMTTSILVFCSAGGKPDENTYLNGFFKVDASTFAASPWSSAPWDKESNAADYGAVDARHDGKAVCAFLDGSVRMLSIEELRDMRLWSRNAAELEDPKYEAVY